MEQSIFTKIINGEIPCHKVYEDDKTLAFMTIDPVRDGHVLVVPKVQIDHIWDLSDDDYRALMATVKAVGQRIRDVFQPKRVGIHVAGMEVPHAHVHVFPFNTSDEYFARPSGAEPDHDRLAEIASQLTFKNEG